MKSFILAFTLLTCCGAAVAQSTPMVTAANKLQADIAKALPASTFSADEKSKLTADAAQLVTNANARAKGETPGQRAKRPTAAQAEQRAWISARRSPVASCS